MVSEGPKTAIREEVNGSRKISREIFSATVLKSPPNTRYRQCDALDPIKRVDVP